MQNHQFYGSGYPHPDGILEGPWWLLTTEQKNFTKKQKDDVNDFVCDEEQKPIQEFYLHQYTGLECLPPDELKALNTQMEENKTWEEENGPLMFDSPEYPQQLVDYREPRPYGPHNRNTDVPMSPAAKAWIVEFKRKQSEQRLVRHRQILKWVRENKFPTRKNDVYRFEPDSQEDGPIPWVFKAPAP